MNVFRISLVLALAGFSQAAAQKNAFPGTLKKTQLYTNVTHDCTTVDLSHWSHPTRQVLAKSGVDLLGLQLCNGGHYPIFTVHFKYDPNGDTSDYFDPLYAQMAYANGFWPYSFVDIEDTTIIDIAIDKRHDLKISYEQF
jgi:hypothetical protein